MPWWVLVSFKLVSLYLQILLQQNFNVKNNEHCETHDEDGIDNRMIENNWKTDQNDSTIIKYSFLLLKWNVLIFVYHLNNCSVLCIFFFHHHCCRRSSGMCRLQVTKNPPLGNRRPPWNRVCITSGWRSIFLIERFTSAHLRPGPAFFAA